MKRWIRDGLVGAFGEAPEVDAFLRDIIAVCHKHNMSLGHEDGHGAFQVGTIDDLDEAWLLDATDIRKRTP